MKALDCCAGAGGLSLGLQRAGFDVLGVEYDATACETHRAQVGPCDCADLWEYEPRERYDLVAGGIPCQSHSVAGKRAGTSDPRGQLYVPFLRIARAAKARAVLVENVRGMASSPSATHGTALLEVLAAIRAAGYEHATHRVLNAADYGVPQTRHRLFIVAFSRRADLERFRWPAPTHEREPGLFGLRRWVSVRDALGLGQHEYAHGRLPHARGTSYQGMRCVDVDAPAPTVGGCSADLLDQPAPCVTATEHKAALAFGSGGAQTNPRRAGDVINPLLARLVAAGFDGARPATTIDTSGAQSAAGHHTTNKAGAVRLDVSQLAALQAFPAGFAFAGNRAQQHRQVGNAVPPPLGEAVGRSILAALGGER